MNDAKVERLLKKQRDKINEVDQSILNLIHKRVESVLTIGKIKAQNDAVVYRPERELEIFDRLKRLKADASISKKSIEAIFTEIISACRGLESELNVAFFGTWGSFSEMAARKQFGHSVTYHPQPSIDEVFYQVEHEHVSFGVVPLENSIEGSVNTTLDLLTESSLTIFCERYLPIHHCLLTQAKDFLSIKKVHSHPQAFAQCRKWISQHLPHVSQRETSNTAEAVKKIKSKNDQAAIASMQASLLYSIPVLRKNIEDYKSNATRFVVLCKDKQTKPSANDKTSLLLSVPDQPGSLEEILKIFSAEKINLKKLESRPSKSKSFEYFFFVDIEGHLEQAKIKHCLKQVKEKVLFFKHLGSYPAARKLS